MLIITLTQQNPPSLLFAVFFFGTVWLSKTSFLWTSGSSERNPSINAFLAVDLSRDLELGSDWNDKLHTIIVKIIIIIRVLKIRGRVTESLNHSTGYRRFYIFSSLKPYNKFWSNLDSFTILLFCFMLMRKRIKLTFLGFKSGIGS